MKAIKTTKVFLVLMLFVATSVLAQEEEVIYVKMAKYQKQKEDNMKTYVIEREIPEAGKLTQEQLKGISQKSNEVLATMGTGIQWVQSYVTDNKVYCVYKAENEELIKEHAKKGGFPADKISKLSTTINPSTGKD